MVDRGVEQSEASERQLDQSESYRLSRIERERTEAQESEPAEIHGHPSEMAPYYHEQPDGASCAVAAQESALDAAGRGYDIEGSMARGANEGWYNPEEPDVDDPNDGTKLSDLGRVWESRGVEVDRSSFAEASDAYDAKLAEMQQEAFSGLQRDLDDGKATVVALDTGYLQQWGGQSGGHAVWVTGIESRPDGDSVVCNDSGLPNYEGCAVRYPIGDFDRAWRANDYTRITSRDPILAR